MIKKNIYTDFPDKSSRERFDTLLRTAEFRLERIRSTGQATLPGQWYDQEDDEWVALLTGEAALVFEEEPDEIVLRPGDYIFIPAHARHRVAWTSTVAETVWLALHFKNETAPGRLSDSPGPRGQIP